MICLVCNDPIINMFYTAVDGKGNIETYCYNCYHRKILDNYTGMSEPEGINVAMPVCECGTKNRCGSGHSGWCPLFRKEFR
jgi:hypothetical protein